MQPENIKIMGRQTGNHWSGLGLPIVVVVVIYLFILVYFFFLGGGGGCLNVHELVKIISHHMDDLDREL